MGQSLGIVLAVAAVAMIGYYIVNKYPIQLPASIINAGDSSSNPAPSGGGGVISGGSVNSPGNLPITGSGGSGGSGNMYDHKVDTPVYVQPQPQPQPSQLTPCDNVNIAFDQLVWTNGNPNKSSYDLLRANCGHVDTQKCTFYKDYPQLGHFAVKGNIISNSCNSVL